MHIQNDHQAEVIRESKVLWHILTSSMLASSGPQHMDDKTREQRVEDSIQCVCECNFCSVDTRIGGSVGLTRSETRLQDHALVTH